MHILVDPDPSRFPNALVLPIDQYNNVLPEFEFKLNTWDITAFVPLTKLEYYHEK
jgi:hypothetical protein